MPQNTVSNEPIVFGSALTPGVVGVRQSRIGETQHLRATILRVNPNKGKCDVYGSCRYFSDVPLPGMSISPDGAGGTVEIPKRGTLVLLRITAGTATIADILSTPADPSVETYPRYPISETQTANNALFSSDDGPSFGQLPTGMLPGDWCKVGEDGQCFALLEGGAVKMRATPLAQVEATRANDTLNVVGRNMNLFTGFGRVQFVDDGGKSSFIFEGGTDQLTQVGGPNTNWQIRARVGGEAEGLTDFQLLDLRGIRVFGVNIESDGSSHHHQEGNHDFYCRGAFSQEIGKGYSQFVRTGSHKLTVNDGNYAEDIKGNHTSLIFGSKSTSLTGSRADNIRNAWTMMVGRTASFSISGAPIPTPISKAFACEVTNGSVVFNVGDPLAGDTQAGVSSFRVFTKSAGGQIELRSGKTGFTWIDSDNPAGSIMIGGNLLSPATEPAVLGLKLISLIMSMAAAFDAHTHISASPGSPTAVPVPLLTSTISGKAVSILSKKVLIGK